MKKKHDCKCTEVHELVRAFTKHAAEGARAWLRKNKTTACARYIEETYKQHPAEEKDALFPYDLAVEAGDCGKKKPALKAVNAKKNLAEEKCSCEQLDDFRQAMRQHGHDGAKKWVKNHQSTACAKDIVDIYKANPDVKGKEEIETLLINAIVACPKKPSEHQEGSKKHEKINCSCKELHSFVDATSKHGHAGAKKWLKDHEPDACAMDIIKVYHHHPGKEGKKLIEGILIGEILKCLKFSPDSEDSSEHNNEDDHKS